MADDGARYVRRTDDTDEERTIFNVKRVPKYGTSNFSSRSLPLETCEYFVRHQIKDNETLNSIALKYGLKTSIIKQLNRMWDDSIFLLDSLLVPIINPDNLPADYDGEILSRSEALQLIPKLKKMKTHEFASRDRVELVTSSLLVNDLSNDGDKSKREDKMQTMTDDYFTKFDSSISKIKSNLERIEKESRPSTSDQRSQRSKHGTRSKVAKGSVLKEPVMKFYRNPDGSSEAKIQEKFEKLEDEMFQL